MVNKVTTSIYLQEDIFRRAKSLGLNISKVSENALESLISKIESVGAGSSFVSLETKDTFVRNTKVNHAPSRRLVKEPRAGFEPATAALPRRCPTRLGHRGERLVLGEG